MGPHSGGGRVARGRNWTKTMTISLKMVRTPDGKHRVDGAQLPVRWLSVVGLPIPR